jgi:hypothetical protein
MAITELYPKTRRSVESSLPQAAEIQIGDYYWNSGGAIPLL